MSNIITTWNDVMLDAIRAGKIPPPIASKIMASVQTAVFDTVNSIEGSPYEGYAINNGPGKLNMSVDAAVASAASKVLKTLLPTQSALIDAKLALTLSGIPDGTYKNAGVNWGANMADQIIALRANDHSSDVVKYTPDTGPGEWSPAPPNYPAALLPQWPNVTPWTMKEGDQFRPPAPPALTSPEYASAFNEVKTLGEKNSTMRTADQTEIALFWADGSGTATPPGHWQEIAQTLSESHNLSVLETARMFALLSLGVADAAIAAWDTKYAYNDWRPLLAIPAAGADGNPDTAPQDGWQPLIATPPFPDYISGHSTFSSAAAKILALFFGDDAQQFSTTSDGTPGVVRSFDSLWEAAEEAGQSRIYGGIHWQHSNYYGKVTGAAVAENLFGEFILKQQFLTAGNDVYNVNSSDAHVICAKEGDDTITGSDATDKLFGEPGDDQLYGYGDTDYIKGGRGNDIIFAGIGDDIIWGEKDNDQMYGEAGDDWMKGGMGMDTLYGGDGDDEMWGELENDILYGGDGADSMKGGMGSDSLYGGDGNDRIWGEYDNDYLNGGAGNDTLQGGRGDDALYGEDGDDFIFGELGNDMLTGGAGRDSFGFESGFGQDRITDFNAAEDILLIQKNINGLILDDMQDFFQFAKQAGSGVEITLGADKITINSIQLGALTDANVDIV